MVKLPKELQNRKHQIEESIEKLKKKIFQTFKSEFIKKHRKFELKESREVIFIDSKNVKKSRSEPINLFFDKKKINVEFNYDLLDEYIFTKPDFKQNFIFYNNYIKHIAHHEFGHLFLTPTIFDLGPIEKKSFLRDLGITDGKLVPPYKQNEYNEVLMNSEFLKTGNSLKNVSLIYLYEQFRQFHATYMIIVKDIDKFIPSEALKLDFDELSFSLRNFKSKKDEFIKYYKSREGINHFQNYPYFTIVWEIMWHTHRFYVFNKWNSLVELFSKYQMTSFLNFLQISFIIFKSIADNYTDIDIIMKIIIKLSKIMDDIDYEALIFNNKFNEQYKQELIKFNHELEEKK